jgi:predicted membrane chloride channel (bestrophin family)
MMAVEIEQPFGDDADDLPLEKYCLNIEENILDVRREVEARLA